MQVKRKTYTTFAAIHLGSEMMRMQITEYRGLGRMRLLERCDYPIRLGEETFKNKTISFALLQEICQVLTGFKRLMREYGVEVWEATATTAVREALNRHMILDQIFVKTGIEIGVAELPQEIYTKYVAVRQTLRHEKISSDKGLLLMDISSGGLGITLVKDGKIEYQRNFHIGIIRIKEGFDQYQRGSIHFNQALTEFLSSTIGPVRQALARTQVRYLVLSGNENELLQKAMGRDTGRRVEHLAADEFRAFFEEIRKLNIPQLIRARSLTEAEAELVLPMAVLYEQLLDVMPSAKEVIITRDEFIDGMTLLHVGQKDADFASHLEEEIISLLHHIGRHYGYDADHVRQVERLALLIFDKAGKKIGLEGRARLRLRAACILHDIGKFVSTRSHSLYSMQLIMGTDILGFGERDKKIVALTAYYHANDVFGRKKAPEDADARAMTEVVKLAAILRLADALDRSYRQKVKNCKVQVKKQELVITVSTRLDFELEEWTFASKAQAVEEALGFKVRLERA